MGKKSSSSQPSQADPLSPSFDPPRMEPPPPYDLATRSPRSSLSSSVRSVDRLDPNGTADAAARTENSQGQGLESLGADGRATTTQQKQHKKSCNKDAGGGCLNTGENVNGCMNYGDGSDGCMNYHSKSGCLNYESTGGCLNYQVGGDWEDNEGCLNFRRGGGCLLHA